MLIDDDYNVTGELAEHFETLLSEEIRQAAAWKAEAEVRRTVDEAFCERDRQKAQVPELALEGVRGSGTPLTVRVAQGLKEKTMVEVMGFEPTASTLRM